MTSQIHSTALPFYTVAELAELWNMPRSHVARCIECGTLRAHIREHYVEQSDENGTAQMSLADLGGETFELLAEHRKKNRAPVEDGFGETEPRLKYLGTRPRLLLANDIPEHAANGYGHCVILAADKAAFERTFGRSAETVTGDGPEEKELDERERTTLLCIIGALAANAKLDLSHPMKAGAAVEAMMPNVDLTGRTIGEHLKKVPDAMDKRKR